MASTLQTSINISTGKINVSWSAEKMFFSDDMTKGYFIMEITGYDFPTPHFGKFLHLYEAHKNAFEYIEDDIKNNKLDADSMLVLEEIKNYTTANVRH